MATNFPTGLDALTNPNAAGGDDLNTPGVLHDAQHSDANDAIEALEAKVGINGSAVASSLDKRVATLEAAGGGAGSADLAWAVGCNIMSRATVTGQAGYPGSGFLYLTGFVPQGSFTAGHINVQTTTANATNHSFLGLYSVAANGDGTLIASTADLTTALGTLGAHKVALSVPVALTAGAAYAVGWLMTTNAPLFAGRTGSTSAFGGLTMRPFAAATLNGGGLSALPASYLASNLTIQGDLLYAEITV